MAFQVLKDPYFMRILFLSTWWPYPPINGSKIRAYNLLRFLARKNDIDLISFFGETDDVDQPELRQLCRSVVIVPWQEYEPNSLKSVLGYFSQKPRSFVSTYSTEMVQAITHYLHQNQPDLVIASEIGTALYISHFQGIPAILDEMQVSIYCNAYRKVSHPIVKFRKFLTFKKYRDQIINFVDCFSACTTASEKERKYFEEILPKRILSKVFTVPNGVDTANNKPIFFPPIPNTLIYSGSITYNANYDAVKYFLLDIWPSIRQNIPQTKLLITGSYDSVNTAALHLDRNTTLTGFVPNINELICTSWASIVPLRIGGGTRLKILESMAFGTPVISTCKGAEGLDVTHDKNILLVNSASDFSAAVISLLKDPAKRSALAEEGRRLVCEKYDWNIVLQPYEEIINRISNKTSQ